MDAIGRAWHKGRRTQSAFTSEMASIQVTPCWNHWIERVGCGSVAPGHRGLAAVDSDELNMWMDARRHGMGLCGDWLYGGRATFGISIRLT